MYYTRRGRRGERKKTGKERTKERKYFFLFNKNNGEPAAVASIYSTHWLSFIQARDLLIIYTYPCMHIFMGGERVPLLSFFLPSGCFINSSILLRLTWQFCMGCQGLRMHMYHMHNHACTTQACRQQRKLFVLPQICCSFRVYFPNKMVAMYKCIFCCCICSVYHLSTYS